MAFTRSPVADSRTGTCGIPLRRIRTEVQNNKDRLQSLWRVQKPYQMTQRNCNKTEMHSIYWRHGATCTVECRCYRVRVACNNELDSHGPLCVINVCVCVDIRL